MRVRVKVTYRALRPRQTLNPGYIARRPLPDNVNVSLAACKQSCDRAAHVNLFIRGVALPYFDMGANGQVCVDISMLTSLQACQGLPCERSSC